MIASKIDSISTYHRNMSDLQKWKYIRYKPSYHPVKGSSIQLLNERQD